MSKQKYPSTTSNSTDGSATRKGREHYSHDKADARKDKRRREADDRQFEFDKLTTAQKLAQAEKLVARKEMAKWAKRLAREEREERVKPVKAAATK